MRFVSNKDSTEATEVSLLAIVEMVVAVWLGFYILGVKWIATAVLLAPLLLLRTRLSDRLTIRCFDRLFAKFCPSFDDDYVNEAFGRKYLLPAVLFSFLSRVVALAWTALRRPVTT